MERFSVDADQAFKILIASSQETPVKLVHVARSLTEQQNFAATGQTPPSPRGGVTASATVRPMAALDRPPLGLVAGRGEETRRAAAVAV
jgi:hypothetical protein